MGRIKKAVLLIEDNPLLTDLYSIGLRKKGLEVIVVHNGEDGLKAIEQYDPDIVLLDLSMPGMSGVEVLKKIRSDPKTKDTKVIILTMSEKEEDRIRAEELGVSDYLLKMDTHLDEIISKVLKHLDLSLK